MHIVERGCTTCWIDELVFSDDPRLTPGARERIIQGYGGPNIGTPRKEGKGWKVERDTLLGEKIKNYPACGLGSK
jgi:protocatechuate 3,4-dioxygenase beta subunit